MFTTAKRIRSIISDCRTEADVQVVLRSHKIRFSYSTDSGFLSMVVPCMTGKFQVYRSCSRKNPFKVIPCKPVQRKIFLDD